MVVVDVVVVVCVVVGARVVEVVVVVSMGRVVVDEDVVDVVVVVCVVVGARVVEVVVVVSNGRVVVDVKVEVVAVEDVVEVVCKTPLAVNAESGTIAQPSSSMFQASMMHVLPPFSYIHNSNDTLPASSSSSSDILHEQPWSFQTPNVLPSIVISPPSSCANMNSIVSCSGISM